MNTHELPMILFTVIAQLCVGTFIVLGVMDLLLSHRNTRRTVRRVGEPVLYAIGPALVLGLAISMLHMNDVTNVINVLRHWDSSWLSREIIFGTGFAGLGFLFAIVSWFRIGGDVLRRILGAVTALVGIALIWSMAMIYQSLSAVPAWNTPIVGFHFFMTTIILGSLAVGTALMFTTMVRKRNAERLGGPVGGDLSPEGHGGGVAVATKPATKTGVSERIAEINAPTTADEWKAITQVMQWISIVVVVAGIAVLVSYPIHISALAAGNQTAQASAAVFSGGFFFARMALLGASILLVGVFGYRLAGQALRDRPQVLFALITTAFLLAFIAELMGRSLHYNSMLRIGI